MAIIDNRKLSRGHPTLACTITKKKKKDAIAKKQKRKGDRGKYR